MVFPEDGEHRVEGRLRRVEHHEHDLGVAGHPAADLLIVRVRRVAARIADGRRVDSGRLPELPLRTPETPHADDELLEPLGKGRDQRVPVDGVARGHHDRRDAAGQRLVGRRKTKLHRTAEEGHRVPPKGSDVATRRSRRGVARVRVATSAGLQLIA